VDLLDDGYKGKVQDIDLPDDDYDRETMVIGERTII
jgi:hypothetical protein